MLARHGTSMFIALVLFGSTAAALEYRQMMRAEDGVALAIQSDGKTKSMEVISATQAAWVGTAAAPGAQVVAGPSAMAGPVQNTIPTVQSQQANGWQPQYVASPARNADLPYATIYSAPASSAPKVAMPSTVVASSMPSMPQIVRAQVQKVQFPQIPPSQTASIPQQVAASTPLAIQPLQSAVAPTAPPKVIQAQPPMPIVEPAAPQPPQPAPAAALKAPIPQATPISQPQPPQPALSPAASPLPVATQGASTPQGVVIAPVAPHSVQPVAPPIQPVPASPHNSGFGYPVPAAATPTAANVEQKPVTTAVSDSKNATPTERHTVFMVLIGSINVLLVILFLRSSPATTKAIDSYMASVFWQSQKPVKQIPAEALYESKFRRQVPVFKTVRDEEYDESSIISMSADEH
jgi:hypothetical protein